MEKSPLKNSFGGGTHPPGSAALNTAKNLRKETPKLGRARDVNDWMDEVDTLRDGVDRLEARLEKLEGRE